MSDPLRLPVLKTYKLFVAGAFPRSESGRSDPIKDAGGKVIGHSSKASRKDLRDAVAAARKALPGWANATAYNRGQVLYRLGEMLEGKRAEFVELLTLGGAGEPDAQREVTASVDRLVAYAGWADKYPQVLGCQNPVAGPYWNITAPEPIGVMGVVCPAALPSLLGIVALVAPAICVGNTVVVLAEGFAPVASVLGEACATSDVPAGVINLLTGSLDELAPVLAKHRDVDAIHAASVSEPLAVTLREGAGDNLKRVVIRGVPNPLDLFDEPACTSPAWLERMVEFKTVWHPVGG